MNSKAKKRDQIVAFRDNNNVYTKDEEMCEIYSDNFQYLFKTPTLNWKENTFNVHLILHSRPLRFLVHSLVKRDADMRWDPHVLMSNQSAIVNNVFKPKAAAVK